MARAEGFPASLERALAVIGDEANWSLGLAWAYDAVSDQLKPVSSWREQGIPVSALDGAAQLGGPLWIEDLEESGAPPVREILSSRITRGFALPIVTRGRVVAVLQFFGDPPDAEDEATTDILYRVAAGLGTLLEGKRAETDLRTSELRFRAVAETAAYAIVSAGDGGRIVYANPAADRLFGWDDGKLIGQPIARLLPGGLEEDFARGMRRNGTEIPLQVSLTTWEDAGRTYSTAVISDLSDRVRAEEALRTSQSSLRETHVLAQLGTWERDFENGGFAWSPEFADILGLASENGEGSWERFLQSVHPDDARNVREYVHTAMSSGQAGPFRHRVVRPDGHVRVLQGRGLVEHDDNGRPSRLRAVSHDVTDLSEFETALERLNRQHALILASASEGIAGVDAEGRVTFLNPAAERMLGWSAGEVLGRNAHETFHHTRADGSPYPQEECPIVTAFRRGEVTHRRGELMWHKDGTGFPVEYFGAPIREDGEVTGGVLIFRDCSEEEKVLEQRGRFEERLRQTERLESLGRLAGGVAHDFNNLLAAILSYAVIVEDKLPESDSSRDDVREIRRAAERAAALTQQLLLFGRGEDVRREVIELNGLISRMEVLLRQALPQGASLELNLTTDPVLIEANSSQIEQVLLNLVVNAGDAMAEGGTARMETDIVGPSRAARLRVRDDGEGMTPEVAARAFEPFFTTKPRGEGTGLGLATVYGVVTQSGGKVELSTAPGGGTEIVATFPAPTGAPLPAAPQPVPAPVQSPTAARTILLVEDDDVVRSLAARILSEADHRVLEVPDPVQALALAGRYDGPIHLLLTDMVMPQLSGSELARRLREQRPEMDVLYMSGHPVSAQGGRTLLHKPFTPDDLRAAVQNVGSSP